MNQTNKLTIAVEREFDGELDEVSVELEFYYRPGSPGKIYGPPENCYPPEPAEFEVYECRVIDGPHAGVEVELTEKETDDALCQWEEHLADETAAAMEDKYDAEREERLLGLR